MEISFDSCDRITSIQLYNISKCLHNFDGLKECIAEVKETSAILLTLLVVIDIVTSVLD